MDAGVMRPSILMLPLGNIIGDIQVCERAGMKKS
jgi:hypothetical protein